ncbi:MAG: helix-turn-helix transcriptional regulator [Anaerolineaceae bacterium]|nr:helix-turn-helix transcriptional regulator [Anaerolineaceae bacterium]
MINKNSRLRSTMTGRIVNHFRILLAQKATRQQQNIALMEVQRETGIAWSTLNSWANNQVTRYDAPVIQALCEYFNCQVGDLLVFEKDSPFQ